MIVARELQPAGTLLMALDSWMQGRLLMALMTNKPRACCRSFAESCQKCHARGLARPCSSVCQSKKGNTEHAAEASAGWG